MMFLIQIKLLEYLRVFLSAAIELLLKY